MPRFFALCFLLSLLLTWPTLAARPPLEFIPNHGQWAAPVRLRADVAPGLTVFLEDQRLTFLRYDAVAWSELAHRRHARRPGAALASDGPVKAHAWVVDFVGARAAAPVAEGPTVGPVRNYFTGADRRAWATDVRAAAAARYHDLWPGIGLRVHSTERGDFEYDLEVSPGADPTRAALRYRGLDGVRLDAKTGTLHLRTALGELAEAAPVAWQTDGRGHRQPVPVRFEIRHDGASPEVGFALPAGYDRSRPLTIDPVLIAATYSGSTAPVFGHTATYDAAGRLYAAGPCYDAGYPTTTGAFDLTHSGNAGFYDNPDVAVSRYSSDGRRLLYATYLGGLRPDYPHSLLVNHQGELLILGSTFSADFPTSASAYDRAFNGRADSSDLFIAKLDSTGSRLLSSTFLGGTGDDGRTPDALRFFYGDTYRGDLAVDSLDRVFIATVTRSRNFPFTTGAVRPAAGFTTTALVARLAPDLSGLDWAAGLGQYAVAYGLYLPPSGAPYVVGTTYSTGFPTTPGALDPADVGRGGQRQRDGFAAQLAPDGSAVRAGTYLRPSAGNFSSQTFFIQPDPASTEVYVLGSSTGFYPATQRTWGQPGGGIIVQRLTADLRQRDLVTTIGRPVTYGYQSLGGQPLPQTDNLSPTAFLVDQCGSIYLSAWGRTTGLPVTGTALQTTTDGQDLYLAVLDPDAASLSYATYLGGRSVTNQSEEHVDGGTSRFDPRGRVYQAVCTNARDFPTTPTAWQPTCRVGTGPSGASWRNAYDEVAVKVDFEPRQVQAAAVAAGVGGSLEAPATVQFTNQSSNFPGTTYQWNFGDGAPLSSDFAPLHLYPDPGTYVVTLIATDSGSCGSADTLQLTLTILPNDSTDFLTYSICRGDSVRFARINAVPGSFRWSPDSTLSSATAPDPLATPRVTTLYEATGRLPGGRRNIWKVSVNVVVPDSIQLIAERRCLPGGIEAVLRLSSPLQQLVWDYGDGFPRDSVASGQETTHFFRHPGQYTVRLRGRDANNCPIRLELPLTTDALFVPNIFTPNNDGVNETFYLDCVAPGTATLQVYNRWGRLVYDSGPDQYANQWDGRNLPDGLYYYYLRLNYAPQGFRGWVEITR